MRGGLPRAAADRTFSDASTERMSSFVSLLSARVQRNRSGSVVIFRIYVSSFDLAISAIHTIVLLRSTWSPGPRAARDTRHPPRYTRPRNWTGHSARLYTVTARHHTRQPPSSLRSETGQSHAHYTCRRCTVEILSRTRCTKSRRDPSRSLTACMPPSGTYWGSSRGAQGELSLEPTHAIVHELILSLSLRSQSPINPPGSPSVTQGPPASPAASPAASPKEVSWVPRGTQPLNMERGSAQP